MEQTWLPRAKHLQSQSMLCSAQVSGRCLTMDKTTNHSQSTCNFLSGEGNAKEPKASLTHRWRHSATMQAAHQDFSPQMSADLPTLTKWKILRAMKQSRGQTILPEGMCTTDTPLHWGLVRASVSRVHVTPWYNANLFFFQKKEGRDFSFYI